AVACFGVEAQPVAEQRPVLALVEVKARLVPVVHVHQEAPSVLVDLDHRRRFAPGQQPDIGRQPLFGTHIHVAALVDARRSQQFHEQLGDQLLAPVDTEGQRLDNQPVAITIHHQAGHTVVLGIDQAIGVWSTALVLRVLDGPPADRTLQARAPELVVDVLPFVPGQYVNVDLRMVVPVAAPQECAALTPQRHDVAVGGAALHGSHRAAEDPGVALLKHFLTVLADQDCWFSHWWGFQFFDVPAADNYTSRRLNFSIAVVRRMLRWQTGRKSASLVPTVRMYCHVFRGNPVIESLAELSQPFLNLPYVRRTRRNHGLEHATVHVLNKPVSGRSDAGGFWLMGDVSTSEVEAAAREALRRMQNGEHQLAVHPNCGTGLVTTG